MTTRSMGSCVFPIMMMMIDDDGDDDDDGNDDDGGGGRCGRALSSDMDVDLLAVKAWLSLCCNKEVSSLSTPEAAWEE